MNYFIGSYKTPAHAIGTNIQKFKKIKGPCTTTSKYHLVNYAYFRTHQRSKKKIWLNSYNFCVLVPIGPVASYT